MKNNKQESTIDIICKLFVGLLAIPFGIMSGLIDVATKKKW